MKRFLFLVTIAAFASAQDRPLAPKQQPPTQTTGRCQIVSPSAGLNFMIDTQTGKVWELTRYTDVEGEPRVWVNMTRIDDSAQFFAWVRTQTAKKDKQ
jgi:hypothetical protein